MLTIKITGGDSLRAYLTALPGRMHTELLRAVTALSLEMEADVKGNKLSGQVLNVQTGALRRSIHSDVTDDGTRIIGRVFSAAPLPYARIHEFGGTTRAHIIEAINGKALKFQMGGADVFRRSVNHPGSKIPERSYLRSTLAEFKDRIVQGMTAAINKAKSGK